MNSFDKQYKQLLKETLKSGFLRPTRSGTPAYSILGKTIVHDMSEGFPILTLRKMPQRSLRVETEFYLKGYTDRKWLTDRGCHFWDEWRDEHSADPDDMGPSYGFEWRHFGADYQGIGDYGKQGIDQIQRVMQELKKNPDSKRLVVSQWNPKDIDRQIIPPCPFAFQLLKYGNRLNLIFYQRSADACLGLPNDFSQHALLLHLICKQSGYAEGKVIGMFGQVELYENHLAGAKELLRRKSYPLPLARTEQFKTILDWSYEDTEFIDYRHGGKILFPISI